MITVKEIIQQSWKLYETNFKTLLKIIVWGFLAASISSVGLYLIEFYYTGHYTVMGLLSFAANLPQILVAIWISIILIDVLNKYLLKKKVVLSESMNNACRIFVPALLLSLLVAVINLGGFLLLIVPGVIFTVWFVFALYEMVLNNKGIKESLKSSKELSKGRWYAIAWRYFAPNLFWAFAGWFTTTILVFATRQLLALTKTTLDPLGTKILTLLLTTVQNAVYIFFVPLIVASVVILYKDLKREEL
ncbi:MAG: hypothetical protein U9P90_01730 [Patescibacteria group bacterium]|nr:hypothetical protein [Patescibacteria group bacterium]